MVDTQEIFVKWINIQVIWKYVTILTTKGKWEQSSSHKTHFQSAHCVKVMQPYDNCLQKQKQTFKIYQGKFDPYKRENRKIQNFWEIFTHLS